MSFYSEIINNNITNRGRIVKLPDNLSNFDIDYFGKKAYNCYNSIYLHTKDYNEHEFNKKIKYNGKIFSKFLFWDIDNLDLLQSYTDTMNLYQILKKYNEKNIRLYFSGNKGFHILYACPELEMFNNINDLPLEKIIKNICIKIANDIKIDTQIYDKTRVLRSTNSKHPKSNLFKIPLTFQNFENGLSTIIELAKNQQKIEWNHVWNDDNEELSNLIYDVWKNGNEHKKESITNNSLINGILNGFEVGNRNSGLTSIAGLFHSKGINDDTVEAILKVINKSNEKPLDEIEVSRISKSVCKYPINDNIAEITDDDIITIKNAGKQWKKLFTENGFCDFGSRFKHLNKQMKICIPGDVIAIVASSGTGKSTLGMEIGNNEAKNKNMYSLFISLEMSASGVFFRAATIETEGNENHYVDTTKLAKELLNDDSKYKEVCNEWKNLLIVDKGGLDLERVTEFFIKAQEKTKNKISNIVIDYAQNLNKSEDISHAMKMAREFKNIAKKLQVKLIVLMQCNKTLLNSFTEVQKNHIEGAGAYFQSCDYIMAFWKSSDYKNRIHSKYLKSRWGESDVYFDMVREGLKFHTEDFLPDKPIGAL